MFTYSHYYKYFASFYCLSAFKYSHPHEIPGLLVEKLNCWVTDIFRLQSSRDLNYLIFVFFVNFQSRNLTLKTLGQGKKRKVFVQSTFFTKKQQLNFFERYLLLVYPYYYVEPSKTRQFSNNQISINFKGFRLPEITTFKPGDYLSENFYDFSTYFQSSLTLTPKNKKSLYEQRFLLRVLNYPLNNG